MRPMYARALATAVAAGFVLTAAASSAAAAAGTVTVSWPMNETSGTVMHDASGHNINGTLRGVVAGVTGLAPVAYAFSGHSVVVVPSSPVLNPGTRSMSFTAHIVTPKRPAEDYDLVRKGLEATRGGDYKMEILRSGQASCHYTTSSRSATITAGPNLANARPHTITCTKSANAVSLIVDGVTYSRSVRLGGVSNSAPLSIGAKAGGGDYFLGLINNVSVRIG